MQRACNNYKLILLLYANNNATSIYATSVNYISAGLDDMQLSRAEVWTFYVADSVADSQFMWLIAEIILYK